MALWLVRAGKYGEDENAALEKGMAIVGWLEMPDVSGVKRPKGEILFFLKVIF